MRYTDQDVEEVINAYFVSYRTSKNARGQTADASTVHRKAHEQGVRAARAALEAMEREPLENVLRAQHVYNIQIEPAGPNFYAEVVSAAHDRRTGTGATIDDAIRAAVAAANEGR